MSAVTSAPGAGTGAVASPPRRLGRLLAFVVALLGNPGRRPLAHGLGALLAPRGGRKDRRRAAPPRVRRRARVIAVNRFFSPDESATSQLLADVTAHLVRQGAPVHVVTSRSATADRPAPGPERTGGAIVHRVWAPEFGDRLSLRALAYLLFYLTAGLRLLLLARPGDRLLVKTDPPLLSVPAAVVARVRRARLVLWHQDIFPEAAEAVGVLRRGSLASRAARRLRDWSLARANRHVVISAGMAARLAALGVPRPRIRVIENWSPVGLAPVPAHANALRHAWGLGGRFVVGYSGNLGRVHQAGQVAELVRRTAHLPDLVWLFVGGGVGMAQVQVLRPEVGDEALRFVPHQPRERLSESLSVPDLHLVSLDPACEGLIVPSKLYGVLAVGRPVLNLGAPDGAVARIVARHGIGCTLGPDPATWERTLAGLMQDRAGLAAMGRRARRLHDAAHRPDRRLAAWQSLLAPLRRRPGGEAAEGVAAIPTRLAGAASAAPSA